ncbi:MAG: hypothetical protein HN692_00455 [Candidatus Cloacimonetes bacterium]|jgi:hypothetical protein|nr:hypothetical protein [Candidatus Cloacimonadota bacterium]
MLENKIDAVVTDESKTAVANAVQAVRDALPFLLDLTPDERRKMLALGDKSVAFVTKALELAIQNSDFLPGSFNVAEMRKDVNLYNDLHAMRGSIVQLQELLEDTIMQAGNEAYSAALLVYHYAKETRMHSDGLDELVDEMSKRFHRKRKKVTEST